MKESKLERVVEDQLIMLYPDLQLLKRARVIKKTRSGKSRYEIDLYLPDLKLGFEVQDFTTHSRDSDSESGHPWRRNGFKNGPRLHDLKRSLAMTQLGVTVIELWEDEILDGSFLPKLVQAIEGVEAGS